MHILPLPLCGLYSICAQIGYGQHHPCKIVLLTLVAHRGVTDLFHEEYIKNTRERPTMNLVELRINNHIVDVVHKQYITNGTYLKRAQ